MMLYLLIVILFILLAMMGWLYHRLREQRDRLEHALARVADPTTPPPERLLTVRVLNPVEVARRESAPARWMSGPMPDTTKRLMFQKLVEELNDALSERGIESVINIEFR